MKIKNTVYLLIALLLASCSKEDVIDQSVVYGGEVNVTFSLASPDPENLDVPSTPLSRAPYLDVTIKNIDVLVFDKDAKFMQRIKINESAFSEVTTAGVKFKIPMTATPDKRIVHLVVNGRSVTGDTDRLDFSSLTEGTTLETALQSLRTKAYTGSGTWEDHVMPLVMWSRFELTSGVNITTKVEGLKLKRAVAAIQVRKGSPSADNGLNDFTIQQITVHKGASIGNLALPTVESTTPNPVAGSELDYTKAWVSGAEPTLYTYERKNTNDDYASVLIKATYKGKEGYYKVLLHNGTQMLDIVRNYRYIIRINSVNIAGYNDVATAISSPAFNAVNIAVEDVSGMTVVHTFGGHTIKVSNSHYQAYGRNSGSTSQVTGAEICTVYSSRNISPTLTTTNGWISNLQATSLGANEYKITGNFTTTGTAAVSGGVTIKCDNQEWTVPVKWNPVVSTTTDTNSAVLNLVNPATDKNWEVKILTTPSATDWLGLHGSNGAASAFPGTGMSAYLDAKFNTNAYLHVGTTGTNRKGALIMSVNGENRRIEIIQ